MVGTVLQPQKMQLALFTRSEERADERSNVGVSPGAGQVTNYA